MLEKCYHPPTRNCQPTIFMACLKLNALVYRKHHTITTINRALFKRLR